MTRFNLYTGNRLENLSQALADVLSVPLSSCFDEEIIIVQSSGMARWISMELARYHGICANVAFHHPNAFIDLIFKRVLKENLSIPSERSVFDPEILTWRIMKLLPQCMEKAGFELVNGYLRGSNRDLKKIQLSERIAHTFDQYVLFRPEMLFSWERGEESHWQSVLWRELVKGNEPKHRAALFKELLNRFADTPPPQKELPERVSIFGISALPRFHMELFSTLARFFQVNLFLMNPCKEYWGDILSEREVKRIVKKEGGEKIPWQSLHLEKGNALLSSLGTVGRDFFDLIYGYDAHEFMLFEAPEKNALLAHIQADILNRIDRGGPPNSGGKTPISHDDRSIQIHACHSPMREAEVLFDNLLALFEKNPDLLPGDIVVMTPDIETYAPYIQAVFDLPADDPKNIPFTIADRSVKSESRIIETFLMILDLCGSRFSASQVFAILESPGVFIKFGLSEKDLKLILRWINETGIRWGVDGGSRKAFGVPEFEENTWKAGLDRLILGYALPGHDAKMFCGILPYDFIEGNAAEILGKFLEFTNRLFHSATTIESPRTLENWADTLITLLETFIETEPEADSTFRDSWEMEIRVIRKTIAELAELQKPDVAGFDETLDISVIKYFLSKSFEKKSFGFGFLAGGVTFCSMLPMRSIPFKVMCLIGMSNDAYPRQTARLGFDLIAKSPKPGDRSRRDDDRYLFLEAVCCARKTLYLSYVGQSIADNSLIPPSVVMSELMDYISQGFEMTGENILECIVTKHRLQPFSPAYFRGDPALFSYSPENCRAAASLYEDRTHPKPFISQGLSSSDAQWRTVNLTDLCRFWINPARYLLNRRLGIYFEEEDLIAGDNEPFEVKGLEKYMLSRSLLEKRFSGATPEELFILTKASGRIPPGNVGRCVFENLVKQIDGFVEQTQPFIETRLLDPLTVDIEIGEFRLTGRVDSIYPSRRLQYRLATVTAKDFIRTWIYHLVLNCSATASYPKSSMLAGLEHTEQGSRWAGWEFVPVKNCTEILKDILEKYLYGLSAPLCFFPESAFKYAHLVLEAGKLNDEALASSRNYYRGNEFSKGEGSDPYYRRCFGYTEPINPDFEKLALDFFEPMFNCQNKLNAVFLRKVS